MSDLSTFKIKKPIVLVGMMGVGKTTFGKKLASTLSRIFYDVDHEIESEIGHSISWIFENAGEEEFRKIEENKIKELISLGSDMVIALGGGAFINPRTRDLIKQKAISIWLQASPETIYRRVSIRKDRPLLEGNDDKLQRIKDIIIKRDEFYSQADLSICTDLGGQKEVVDKMIHELSKKYKD